MTDGIGISAPPIDGLRSSTALGSNSIDIAAFGLSKAAYTIDELCQISTLGRNSIYNAVSRGELIPSKLRRRTFFAAPEIARWLSSLRCPKPEAVEERDCEHPRRPRGRPRKNQAA